MPQVEAEILGEDKNKDLKTLKPELVLKKEVLNTGVVAEEWGVTLYKDPITHKMYFINTGFLPTRLDPYWRSTICKANGQVLEITSEGEFEAMKDELKARSKGVLNCPVVEKYLAKVGRRKGVLVKK